MHKKFIYIIGLVLIIAVGGVVYWQNSKDTTNTSRIDLENGGGVVGPNEDVGEFVITKGEVAERNSRSECWTIVNGVVYDLTSWIANHPGGQDSIVSMCGKDASASFNSKHGGEARPLSVLEAFKIGVLAQ